MPTCRIVALACLIALSPIVSATTTRTETQTYYGSNDLLRATQFDNVCLGGPHAVPQLDQAGGACFDVLAGETLAVIEIDDRSGLPVGGHWSVTTLDGTYVSGAFCDGVTIPLPADAAVLSVAVDGPVQGPFACNPSGRGPGVGTTGVIRVTFS